MFTALRSPALVLLVALAGSLPAADKPWPPVTGVPLTSWGASLAASTDVWPDYPRPQLVRGAWLTLNGLWDFAVTVQEAPAPSAYAERILVPFAPQAVLSRIGRPVDAHSRVWYHRRVTLPADWAGKRIILHCDAVNWEAHVLVNQVAVGEHRGGYDGFAIDITPALTPGGEQDIVISAWNPVETGQPRGKQALKPGGIFYTPTTGIWQTVWLEPVPESHITDLRIVPDADQGRLLITPIVSHGDGMTVEVVASEGGQERARSSGRPGETITVVLPSPHLWWPATPFLYSLQVTVRSGTQVIDEVGSYAGLRKIALGPDVRGRTCMQLNNVPLFQLGLLDQGFWPDGIYTAPTDDALRSDIEAARRLGCNMLRNHVKVEPERWYTWADRLGMLVWQDMPSATEMGFHPRADYLKDIEGNFETELRHLIQGRGNHPSIIVWVPFNEGWGLSEDAKHERTEPDRMDQASRDRQARMVQAIRQEDATRLINAESGAGGGANQGANFWDAGLGDIIDFHCYGGDAPHPEAHRASVIGECGWGLALEGSLSGRLKTSRDLGESAIVITQLTDVENETNGALRYDRTPKAPFEPQGQHVIALLHAAGYLNYPGGAP